MSPYTAGFTLSAAIAIVFNTLLVFAKETYPELNAAMKNLLGHHWITHGVVVVLVFLVFGFFLSKMTGIQKMRAATLTTILIVSVVLSGLGIFGFFLFL